MAPTFGAAVAVDGPYQNQLGDGVGNVAQDVEDVEAHGCSSRRRPAQAEVARSRRGGLHVSASADKQPLSESGGGWCWAWG